MNSKWMWAVVIIAALVLALSHYAVWHWARSDLKLEWMEADKDTVVTVHTDTLYLRDTVKAIQYVNKPIPIPKPIAVDSFSVRQVDTLWNELVRVCQPAREVLDTLGITGTVDYEPWSRVFYNNLALKRAWQGTTITRTVIGADSWQWTSFFVGTTSMAIVFAIILMLVG